MDPIEATAAMNALLDSLIASGLAEQTYNGSSHNIVIGLDGDAVLEGDSGSQRLMWRYGADRTRRLDLSALSADAAIAEILAVSRKLK